MSKTEKKRYIKFVLLTASIILAGIIILMLYNYFSDPYNYFRRNDYDGTIDYSQYYMTKHVLDADYDCYIVGGSNSAVIDTFLMQKYTGYSTYLCNYPIHDIYSSYRYINYLIDNASPKCIVLHLSGFELFSHTDQEEEICEVPAIVDGSWVDRFLETLRFLTKKPFDKLGVNTIHKLDDGRLDWMGTSSDDGQLMVNYYKIDSGSMSHSFDDYVSEKILNNYDERLQNLYKEKQNVSPDLIAMEENLHYIREIKNKCDSNNVKLIVIKGAMFNTLRYRENEYCCDFLLHLADITDYYAFDTMSPINTNPYNFYDPDHYSNAIADEEIKFIFGEGTQQDFGCHVTKDNVMDYVSKKKDDYKKITEEYENTGTIAYGSFEDEGNITSGDVISRLANAAGTPVLLMPKENVYYKEYEEGNENFFYWMKNDGSFLIYNNESIAIRCDFTCSFSNYDGNAHMMAMAVNGEQFDQINIDSHYEGYSTSLNLQPGFNVLRFVSDSDNYSADNEWQVAVRIISPTVKAEDKGDN